VQVRSYSMLRRPTTPKSTWTESSAPPGIPPPECSAKAQKRTALLSIVTPQWHFERPWAANAYLVQMLVCRQRKKVRKSLGKRHHQKRARTRLEFPRREGARAGLVAQFLELLRDRLPSQGAADPLPAAETSPVPHPLPHLRARDLGRRGIFHQVVD